jgi:hypothetical protein
MLSSVLGGIETATIRSKSKEPAAEAVDPSGAELAAITERPLRIGRILPCH